MTRPPTFSNLPPEISYHILNYLEDFGDLLAFLCLFPHHGSTISPREINATNKNEQTLLHLAAIEGHSVLVAALLANPSLIIYPSINCTAAQRHLACISMLQTQCPDMAPEVDPSAIELASLTPLIAAIRQGHVAMVSLLLTHPAISVNPYPIYNYSPLGEAIRYGHTTIAAILLARSDIQPNSSDVYGFTPLCLAVRWGRTAIVEMLLRRPDIDVNGLECMGITPLAYSAREGNIEVMRLLLRQANVGVDLCDKHGKTPLMYAAQNGRIEAMKLLMEREDTDLNARGKFWKSALAAAAEAGQVEALKLLAEWRMVDGDRRDDKEATPLLYAPFKGHVGVQEVDVNARNCDGRPALAHAV
jgi:ankyrin repeat protein